MFCHLVMHSYDIRLLPLYERYANKHVRKWCSCKRRCMPPKNVSINVLKTHFVGVKYNWGGKN